MHRSLAAASRSSARCSDRAQIGSALAGARDERLAPQHSTREHHDHGAEHGRMVALLGGEAAHDGAEQDRHEGRAFDQRVAGGQFFLLEVVRQDAVLDRAEQRRDHAEQKQRREQDRDRVQPEADDAEAATPISASFTHLRDDRLVEAVGDLAAQPRQEEERADEHRRRQRHQRLAVTDARREQDQEHQRVLEEVVVEGREELAPEQRREAAGRHQGAGHRSNPLGQCLRN